MAKKHGVNYGVWRQIALLSLKDSDDATREMRIMLFILWLEFTSTTGRL